MPFSSVLGASSVIKPGVCTSTTRPSVPYEGQLIYETDTDRVASYNGSAWVYTATGGLVLVKTQTIGTTVSSVEVTGAFSSTYDNYLITISGGAASTSVDLIMQLGSTTTNYTRTGYYVTLGSATLTGYTGTDWRVGAGSTDSIMGMVNLFGPNLTKRTTGVAHYMQPVTSGSAVHAFLLLNDTTSYTAFTISTNTGTITGGTIRVYGYPNS